MISVTQMEQIVQQIFKQINTNIHTKTTHTETAELRVTEKLTYHNYTTWCKHISIAFESQGRLSHITAAPPSPTDLSYTQRKQMDSLVFTWLISNISSELVNQFLDYTTSWDLWKDIETLLNSGRDELQIFDLTSKAASLKKKSRTHRSLLHKNQYFVEGN